jgi:IclR family transcriptional regulator, blcABC operon repressor
VTVSTMPADPPVAEPPKGLVPAVARAARLLELLASAKEPVTLAALTARLGLPKSSVHALCSTLVHAGLVARYEDGNYHLGVRVMDLAHAFLARTDLATDFARILETRKPMPEESIVLSVLDGADIVYVACRNGTRTFGFNFRHGMRLPANCTASGKALLASLPPERIAGLARERGFLGLTARSVTELEPLQKQLAQVRRRGYAIDSE